MPTNGKWISWSLKQRPGNLRGLSEIAIEYARLLAEAEKREATLKVRIEALETKLREIAESDDIENALDPARNKRIARTAFEGD